MRPALDTNRLFAAERDTIPASRSPLAHSDVVPSTARAEELAPRLHPLTELDRFLGARLLRLETTGSDEAILSDARVIRRALARAGAFASIGTPATASFDSRLGETLRAVYAWVFGTLDALFLGDSVRPLPRRVVDALTDHAEVCATRGQEDPAFASLRTPLVELHAASARLGRPRP